MKARVQRNVSALIGAIGLVLVVMMITTEGEPGALPLGLILIGAVGYVAGRMREKSATRQ
jgi:preprotein translocase subunit Sss1